MKQLIIDHAKWLIVALFAAIAIIQFDSCNSSTTSPTALNTVTIAGTSFTPTTLIVPKGTVVTWRNDDSKVHTATADDGNWDTKDISPGEAKSITFDKIGSFPYHCIYHVTMGMKGTIIVQ